MSAPSVIQKKVCLLGDFSVGKTSLIRRFVYDIFEEKYLSTIGVNISRKVVEFQPDHKVQLLIWDLAGGESFTGMHTSYLQGASGALLVCDLTRQETFPYLEKYWERLRAVSPMARVIVIGNKVDLIDEQEITEETLASLAAKLETSCYLTSAKTGVYVEEVFLKLAQLVLE